MNPRITPKDKALIKGALRRVFSRSELRRSVLEAAIIEHSDPKRPKVKRWVKCATCGKPEAISAVQVDHILPFSEIKSLTSDDISWDTIIDKLWCHQDNLQVLDKACHLIKSKAENKLRREYRNLAQKKEK